MISRTFGVCGNTGPANVSADEFIAYTLSLLAPTAYEDIMLISVYNCHHASKHVRREVLD